MSARPEQHVLSPEEVAFCVRTGLARGYDVDDGRHQYTHLCWPYAAYEGTLCKSSRLWGHAGPPNDEHRTIDCAACLRELERWMRCERDGGEASVLLTIIGRLAQAAECLTNLAGAADNYLGGVEKSPEYAEAMAHGYPETSAADMRAALAAADEMHRKNAESYARNRDGNG